MSQSFRVRAGVLTLLASLPWLLSPPTAAARHLQDVRQSGKLVMLCVPHQQNAFVKTNLATGPMRRSGTAEHFQGIDVDLMAAFARRLGVELEVRPAIGAEGLPAYSALIPALLAGEGDVIASSFSITPERQKKIDFSDPYFQIRPVVVVREGSPIHGPDDLAGKLASTIRDSSQEEHLRKLGVPEEQIHYVEFMLENYLAVEDGEADFTVVDSGSARRMVVDDSGLRVAFELAGEESYGIGVAPGSDLRGELNAFLEEMRQSGELAKLFEGRP